MNNVTIDTGIRTNGQFTIDFQRNGNGGCIPIINGKEEPSLMFGYASESDKEACMNLLRQAVVATGGNIPMVRQYLMNAVTIAANDIHPNEAVMIDGTEILIDYLNKAAYEGTEKIADLDDLDCTLPAEAIKAMLTDRVRIALADREQEYLADTYYDEDDFEY